MPLKMEHMTGFITTWCSMDNSHTVKARPFTCLGSVVKNENKMWTFTPNHDSQSCRTSIH